MKKSNKNVSAMLAGLATGNGGVSLEQSKLNDAYEKMATLYAKCLLAGLQLQFSGDPEDEELIEDLVHGLDGVVELVAQALLRHKGEFVGDILRATVEQ